MPRKGLDIAGGSLIFLGLGGIITSAVLLPSLVPIFVVVGTGGAAVLGKDRIERCLTNALKNCLGGEGSGPVTPALEVNTRATVVNATTPPPINRNMNASEDDNKANSYVEPSIARNVLYGLHNHEMTLHRHESYHTNGQTYTYDERLSVTEDETNDQRPVIS